LTEGGHRAAAEAITSAVAVERTGVVGGVIRLTGDWDLAEDCVQDAVERALGRWPIEGVPRSPGAWLTTVARNRALDVLRRRRTERAKLQERAVLDDVEPGAVGESDHRSDDRLRPTRFDAGGDLVPMEEQDSGRWDPSLIEEGKRQLRRAAGSGRPPGPFRLQAQIAACHTSAPAAAATDWGTIVLLYDALLAAQPSPVVALNRAIAVGFRDGYETGLVELAPLEDTTLAGYYLLPAARADLLRRLGRTDDARRAYQEALHRTPSGQPEHRLLQRRLIEVSVDPGTADRP
jgi:predicted RNA polymerase sigma factor